MYNDNTFDNLFTGYESGGDYIFPTASQNLVITFDPTPDDVPFHLSAMEGDFTTDAVTITSETGESEDITIGNAPAKVLTATMLNPSNTMGSLVWGDGKVYIGCETATATADAYNSYPVHVLVGSVHYSIDSSGRPRRNSTSLGTLGGTGVAVISNSDGSDVLFISTTSIGRRVGGSYTQVTTPSASQSYLAEKFRAMPYSVGVLLDANGCPSVYNSVEKNTKQTFGYVPMGVFDFSNVDAFGITFGVEAYDKMTVFDGDCTTWWNAIDFDNGGSGRMLSALAGMVYTQFGFIGSPTISASAVNDSLVWNTNPITSYAVTGRDILKWLAEAMGCNARMGRTGGLEFWTFATEPITTVATIYPDIIISNTRVKGKATVPKMTETICYNVLGAGYQVGSSGSPYYVVANPFIDPSGDLTSLTNINGLVTGIPAYYPNTISVACGDPRWDAGDFVTVNTTDGTSPYAVPIMHETLSWNGTCIATLSATGKQVRDIPESMLNTDLSSMVGSNPSAVVNKIMAKGITVYDSSNNVLFSAIGDDHLVEIAGFTVQNGKLVYETANQKVSMATVTGFTAANKINQHSAGVSDGLVSVSDGSQVQEPYGALEPEQLTFGAMVYYKTASYRRDGLTLWQKNVGDASLDLTNGLHIDDNTNDVDVTPTGISISDGVDTTTFTAGIGKRVHSDSSVSLSSGTTMQNLGDFTLTKGLWMVSVTVRFASNATGRRAMNISNTSGGSAYNVRWGNTSAATNGAYTYLHLASSIGVTAASATFYINAYQNSGGSLTTAFAWDAVRVY